MKHLCVCIRTPYNVCVLLGAFVYVSDKYRECSCIYLITIQNVNVLHINLNPKLYKSTYHTLNCHASPHFKPRIGIFLVC